MANYAGVKCPICGDVFEQETAAVSPETDPRNVVEVIRLQNVVTSDLITHIRAEHDVISTTWNENKRTGNATIRQDAQEPLLTDLQAQLAAVTIERDAERARADDAVARIGTGPGAVSGVGFE